MCKYKTKSVIVDAEQFLCEPDKIPTSIPKGVYEKKWKYDTGKNKGDIIMTQWGIDNGMFGFLKVKNGDWVVRYPDDKFVSVYPNEKFEEKFETLAFPQAWES